MDNELNKKHKEAARRFDAHQDLENGYLKVNITSGEEIGISEELFKMFNEGCMQINQKVKEGRYQLVKQDGFIVSVSNVNIRSPRLKNGNEGDPWTLVNLNQSSQNVGMALLGAMKYYWTDRKRDVGKITELIDMNTGYFSRSNYRIGGYFTYQGYIFQWSVENPCAGVGEPNNCISNDIQGDYVFEYEAGGSIYKLKGKSSALLVISSIQTGSYSVLSNAIRPKP
jgi:hypothetical protein